MNCKCGGERFMAHQICRHDVVVNSEGGYLADHGIYDSETPYGPFTCLDCGAEYDELRPLPITLAAGEYVQGKEAKE